jgi:hypothetical protein
VNQGVPRAQRAAIAIVKLRARVADMVQTWLRAIVAAEAPAYTIAAAAATTPAAHCQAVMRGAAVWRGACHILLRRRSVHGGRLHRIARR